MTAVYWFIKAQMPKSVCPKCKVEVHELLTSTIDPALSGSVLVDQYKVRHDTTDPLCVRLHYCKFGDHRKAARERAESGGRRAS